MSREMIKRQLPNTVSLLRFGFVVPMVVAISRGDFLDLAAWVAGFVVLDKLDGILARSLKSATVFGRILDSFVDKVSFLMIFLAFSWYHWIPWWLFISIGCANIIQIGLMVFKFLQGQRVFPKTFLPIVASFFLFLSIVFRDKTQAGMIFALFSLILWWNHVVLYARELQMMPRRSFRLPLPSFINHWAKEKRIRRDRVETDRWLTRANIITAARATLIPWILFDYWIGKRISWIFLLLLFFLGDIADGVVARRYRETSRWGKILDAVSDKTLFLGFVALWTIEGRISQELLIVLLVRIVVVGALALFSFYQRQSLPIARFSILANIALILLIIFSEPFWFWLTILLNIQTMIDYAVQTKESASVKMDLTRV